MKIVMIIIRIILIIAGIAVTISCLCLGKFVLACFDLLVVMMNLYFLFEACRW